MKIYIISGEESGDLYGSLLVEQLLIEDKDLIIRGIGGDKMKSFGIEISQHISEFSIMGLKQVLLNLYSLNKKINLCKSDIQIFKPDLLILIDFPGFNFRLLKFAKKNNIKVIYYISPKVWAWDKNRIKKIRRYVDELIVIFPFEVDFFNAQGIDAKYFGNPLTDRIRYFNKKINRDKEIISLLPGSRKQEVKRILPIMLEVTNSFPDYHFVIATTREMSSLCKLLSENYNIEIIVDQTYSVLNSSKISIITSGTATLEAALLRVKQVVCYKTDFATFLLAKILLKIKWISLVNILMNKEVVKELIQDRLCSKNLKNEIIRTLRNQNSIISEYENLIKLLRSKNVSSKVARFILEKK
tara:strand:- start:12663 stop:13733 length:1071 start_codon:yes stop_codon:yes gene_type:complete